MSSLPELQACLSILPSALPAPGSTDTTTVILVLAFVAAGIIHYVSPLRLTRVLVAAIANVEKTYLEALETGLLSASDIDRAEILSSCVDPLFPSSLYLFGMRVDSNSKSQKYAKPPCATPSLTPEPCASF
jgi:hypothetical protein